MLGSWYDPKRRKIAEGKILGGGHISIWWALLWILRWCTVVLHIGKMPSSLADLSFVQY